MPNTEWTPKRVMDALSTLREHGYLGLSVAAALIVIYRAEAANKPADTPPEDQP